MAMAVRKQRIALVLLVTLCLTGGFGHASEKAYQAGKLVSVQSPELPFPLPTSTGSQPIVFPLHVTYLFEIQQGEVGYVGSCRMTDYRAEWKAGDNVQFRLDRDKMYLKRPNGKEFRLQFLLQARLGPDGKPVTILPLMSNPDNVH
jgi:hypothetical protein